MAKQRTVSVSFGNVSVGAVSTRIGIRMPRNQISLDEVDTTFCNRRLDVVIKTSPSDDDQKVMFDKECQLTSVADVKSYGTNDESHTFGLAFSRNDVNMTELLKFVRRAGKLTVRSISEIPTQVQSDDEQEE